jgi:hypothetical protein
MTGARKAHFKKPHPQFITKLTALKHEVSVTLIPFQKPFRSSHAASVHDTRYLLKLQLVNERRKKFHKNFPDRAVRSKGATDTTVGKLGAIGPAEPI